MLCPRAAVQVPETPGPLSRSAAHTPCAFRIWQRPSGSVSSPGALDQVRGSWQSGHWSKLADSHTHSHTHCTGHQSGQLFEALWNHTLSIPKKGKHGFVLYLSVAIIQNTRVTPKRPMTPKNSASKLLSEWAPHGHTGPFSTWRWWAAREPEVQEQGIAVPSQYSMRSTVRCGLL